MAQTQSRRVAAVGVSLIALAGAGLGAAVMATAEAQENLTPSLTTGVAPGGVPSFADLIEHVSPAVVSVEVRTEVSSGLGGSQFQLPEGLPPGFEDFFRSLPQGQGGEAQPREAAGEGSGFFISADGLLVTNYHVVSDATRITVVLNDGNEYPAEVVGTDEPTDLALLRVEGGSDFPFVQFDTDPHYRVGDWVVAVGNPFGFGGSATAGIISAIGREEMGARYNGFIQIDAPINRGNSGGPTFDLNGNVIGVNSQIYSPTGGNVGIGFAIPSDVAANVIDQLAENGKVVRGWLGVTIQDVTDELADAFGVSARSGALVSDVTAGSPAADAGFLSGDIVLEVDGEEVDGSTELTRKVGSLRAGEQYAFGVLREGRERTIRVTLGERPSDEVLFGEAETPSAPEKAAPGEPTPSGFGLSLSAITPAVRTALGIDDAVTEGVAVVAVEDDSEAADLGLSPGLVITQVNGRAISSPEEFTAAAEAARSDGKPSLAMLVRTPQGSTFVALPFDDESDAG